MQNFSRVFRVKNALKSSFLATKCCIFGNEKWRVNDKIEILLSGKNKQKVLYLFIHRYCSRFTHPGAWFSVSN